LTPIVLSATLTTLLVSSWFAGYFIEAFLASEQCWWLAKRAAYMTLALWFETSLVYALWRWL
jgi:hypothetical protein